jgi:predicted Zn-dependent protease
MNVFNRLLSLEKDNPLFLTQKGILYRKENKLDSAKKVFAMAMVLYQEKQKKSPEDVNTIVSEIMLIDLSDGRKAALKELQRQIAQRPQLKSELISKTGF